MAPLARAVGKHAALQHGGLQAAGHQHGSAGDETVHHDHTALGRRLQHRAHQRRHLVTPQRSQGGQRRGGIGIGIQRLLQHGAFALYACCVQACASACHLGQRQPSQPRQQQRRHRGVANAHLSQQQCIARQATHHLHAVGDGLGTLLRRHGRAHRCIGRAGRHLVHQQARRTGGCLALRDGARHAAVHHRELQPVLARQHAHRSATGQKVFHHLPGHIAREGRDPLGRQAMVARAHQHLRLQQRGGLGAQHLADAQGQGLQPPQRPQRLGLVVEQVLQAGSQWCVGDVGNGGDGECGEGLHGVRKRSRKNEMERGTSAQAAA